MKGIIEFIKLYGKMAVFFTVIIVVVAFGLTNQLGKTEENSKIVLEEALHRATIQCYAIESRYPPDLEYLETNYGVYINKDKFKVFFEGIASNIMPDITVVSIGEEAIR